MGHKNPITFTHQTVVIVVYIVLIVSFSWDSMLGCSQAENLNFWRFLCYFSHVWDEIRGFLVTLPTYMAKSGETWSALGVRKSGEIHQAQGSTFWLVFRGPRYPWMAFLPLILLKALLLRQNLHVLLMDSLIR
jgi:hypothetical protein